MHQAELGAWKTAVWVKKEWKEEKKKTKKPERPVHEKGFVLLLSFLEYSMSMTPRSVEILPSKSFQ